MSLLASAGVALCPATTLTWRDNSVDETGFHIERARADLVFQRIASVGRNVTSYDDNTTELGVTYNYRVAAYNAAGVSAYSNIASGLGTPGVPVQPAQLGNLSTRAPVGSGEDILVAGFVILGSGRKDFLIRGAGPALARFGVAGALANPTMTVYDSAGRPVVSNDDWNSLTTTPALFTGVGAFPFDLNSTDSALRVSLDPGAYTIHVADTAGRTGIALAEIYELDGNAARLGNLSARALVGTGNAITIAGFVVQGAQPGRFLIRAVGPTLADLGVGNRLPDPVINLTSGSGTVVASNDNWTTNEAAVNAAIASVAAFPLRPGSRDAALVVTLPAGNYTVQVSDAGGASGIALVEIYLVP